MFEMHLISGITDESPRPLVKLNVKTGPLRSFHFGIYYSFGLSRLFFLRFSECFPVISGFCIAVQYPICCCFSIIFWVFQSIIHRFSRIVWRFPFFLATMGEGSSQVD